jgi:hypothetical protein
MKPRKRKPQTATERSQARNRRAARILGGIALNTAQDEKLDSIMQARGMTAADWVREKIEREPLPPARRAVNAASRHASQSDDPARPVQDRHRG